MSHRPSLPRLLLAALLTFGATAALPAADAGAGFVRIWPEYRTADSFVRIGEYFGGAEKAPELIVRSQPERRDGYYFLARVKTPAPVKGGMLAVEYFAPGDEVARVRFFPVNLPGGSRAILAGLTGADWPDQHSTPTAWRLRLLAADGVELAREQSFLWALPTAPAPETAAAPTPPAST